MNRSRDPIVLSSILQGNSVTTVYKFFSWIARSPKHVWDVVLEFMEMAENKQIKNICQKNLEGPDPPVAIKNLFLEAAALAEKGRGAKLRNIQH